MLSTIKKFFRSWDNIDPLVEGMYADQYADPQIKDYIFKNYQKTFPWPEETPETHPWKFDPFKPPTGWRFDPYYHLWVNEKV